MSVQLIAHALLKHQGRYLVIKRSMIKRGEVNTYPGYYDIPGGRVEYLELPRKAARRESMEEVNQDVQLGAIVHEDSNVDEEKKLVFTRLVYEATLVSERPIILDPEEHSDYRWIESLKELKDELYVPYLAALLPKG
ncbi:NUDIX hydrolase [Streptococcus himalayensis]|uniref:DNA mismatch repair protein MutT n=1 Tax=Streptococcus himalayensis TaxID=1888195 RepID=A0A917A5T2_9STRE|nr:NUDIX hydrolase [Streptococcus himalayensis]GGE29542.1 DNA mismatch repair protein MutT [Streptococcus himalayensis]